jgi:hypothetical protein
MQLEEFEPMLRRVLARPVRSIYLKPNANAAQSA